MKSRAHDRVAFSSHCSSTGERLNMIGPRYLAEMARIAFRADHDGCYTEETRIEEVDKDALLSRS